MSAAAVAAIKAVITFLTSPKFRKAVGWILVAILSPVIVLILFLCSLAAGGAEHNNLTVEACFYGTEFSDEVPAEYKTHITNMRSAFSLLDSAVASVNGSSDGGNGLDPLRVKSVFYALCFGESAPSARAANHFVECFYINETRSCLVTVTDEDGATIEVEEEYTATIPLSLTVVYANLSTLLGREITDEDKSNVESIYRKIAGPIGGGSYGGYLRGENMSVELDISDYVDPYTKSATDLTKYAIHAWESGWGYVWGTCGWVLTDSLFQSKIAQYPKGVGDKADFIAATWLGGRTTDCVGLIKGYGWLDPETLEIGYAANGMPDISANQMYYSASVSGTIDTIPEKPGLAVWMDGHIGVYIGNGEVIESMGTKYGVVKTKLEGRGWTHWLEIPYINYN